MLIFETLTRLHPVIEGFQHKKVDHQPMIVVGPEESSIHLDDDDESVSWVH